MLIEFSGCDAIELRLKHANIHYRCIATCHPEKSFRFEIMSYTRNEHSKSIPCSKDNSVLEQICRDIFSGDVDSSLPCFTKNGSFWTSDTTNPLSFTPKVDEQTCIQNLSIGGDYRSLALIPFVIDEENVGLLQLKSRHRYYFTAKEIEFYEGVAQTFGIAVADRRAQADLRERVKELTCLYSIAQVVQRPGISLEEILQNIVEFLPPAFQYPEIACARIILDEHSYSTTGFREDRQKLKVDIIAGGRRRGLVEVAYEEKKLEIEEDHFLKEEQHLLDTVARQVALIIERRQTEKDKLKLQEQIRHADRLATIGQLAASVAHEMNEPLGSILGFAQLARKCPGLPRQAEQDIEKIVNGSLHAREVVKKLLIFTRQMPTWKTRVNLNQIVEEELYFLESRCVKQGIKLIRLLSPNLPEITADPALLNQVLVNLVVNAAQAMPEGGRLTIQTEVCEDQVLLIVEDTGIGMSDKVLKQIFLPFFTTKEVSQGTGLGLPVVHGIVTSHGGSIKLKSKVGQGTRFEILLPIDGPARRGE